MKGLFIAAAAAAAAGSPTPAQIRTDVARAEHSRSLWATVNFCNTKHHPHQIGIRGQMPALGFPAQLQMTVKLRYWDTTSHRFQPIPNLSRRIVLGTVSYGTVQQGVRLTFAPPVLLSGTISFSWQRHGKTLATVTKPTTRGNTGVDDGDPKGYSAATCRIDPRTR